MALIEAGELLGFIHMSGQFRTTVLGDLIMQMIIGEGNQPKYIKICQSVKLRTHSTVISPETWLGDIVAQITKFLLLNIPTIKNLVYVDYVGMSSTQLAIGGWLGI